MSEVSAALVRDLRERTGAGMMDCKKALTETGGDLEAAVDWLRKKGLAAAQKKAGRVAAEGLVGVVAREGGGVVVEVNAETDFVARNETFQGFVATVAELAFEQGDDVDSLKNRPFPGTGRTLGEELTHLIATIGENMELRRVASLSVAPGVVASYVHNAVAPGLGKIGVIVALKSAGDPVALGELGKALAMHVAAASPRYVAPEHVDAAALERERAVLEAQAKASSKPDNVVQKMVEGRLRKFYEDVCLLEQTYVIDGENKVRKVLEAAAREVGVPVEVTGFVRFALGEGVERQTKDFAAEVAAQVGR
jgi:elongation factor Ts